MKMFQLYIGNVIYYYYLGTEWECFWYNTLRHFLSLLFMWLFKKFGFQERFQVAMSLTTRKSRCRYSFQFTLLFLAPFPHKHKEEDKEYNKNDDNGYDNI